MEQNLKLYLKLDWDFPSKCPETENTSSKGHFVGRRREIDRLVNDLHRRNQGSFLISGQRGVGKTSLVYKALQELIANDKKYIFVLLNASQLEISEDINLLDSAKDRKIPARRILDNLIRRFYTATENYNSKLGEDISSDIEKLFNKAIATKWVLNELKTSKQTKKKEQEESLEKNILLDQESLKRISALTCFLFAGVFQFYKIPFFSDFWQKIFPLFLAFPLPFIIKVEYSKRQLEQIREEDQKSAKEYYEIDANIGNLEYDLEQVHKKIVAKGYKIVYVIDELDKLTQKEGTNDVVIEVLKFFKSLFTLSSAMFIFIADEKLFKKINEGKNNKDLQYTYFSQKYFLQRPDFKDLEDFIDQIVARPDKKELQGNRLYRDFRNYAIYLAKSDFFELYDVIRDFIQGFNAEREPIIEIKELIGDELLKSKMQKCLGLVYSKYIFNSPSKWFDNEELLKELYIYIEDIIASPIDKEFQDVRDNSNSISAIRFLNTLLYRIKAFRHFGLLETIKVNGQDIPINSYQWLGRSDFIVPQNLNIKSEMEQKFIDKVGILLEKSREIVNCSRELQMQAIFSKQDFDNDPKLILEIANQLSGVDVFTSFANNENEYKNFISKNPPYTVRREEIESRTGQVEDIISSLSNNTISIFFNFLKFKISTIDGYRLQERDDLFSHFQALKNSLRKVSHKVILKNQNDTSKQLLLTINIPSNLIEESEKLLKDNDKSFKIINFQTDDKFQYKNMGDSFWNIKIDGFKDVKGFVIKVAEWFNV